MLRDYRGKNNLLKSQVVAIRLGRNWHRTLKPLVIALLVFTMLLYVGLRFEIQLLGYRISDAQKVNTQLMEANRTLELKLATLTDPNHVIEVAQKDYGLSDPGGRIIYLE